MFSVIYAAYMMPSSNDNTTLYFFLSICMQNPIVSTSTVDNVHALGAQMGSLQISTATGGPGAAAGAYPALHPGAAGGGGQPQPNAQYQMTPHGPQYTHQTASGWNVQHLSTPPTILHQVRQKKKTVFSGNFFKIEFL